MVDFSVPEWVRKPVSPGVRGFALLAGIEAAARGILLSVFPLAMYRALGDAGLVSELYFLVGIVSLVSGLMVPLLTRAVPRRWVFSLGTGLYLLGAAFGCIGGLLVPVALLCNSIATATVFVCFNAYVLDTVGKAELGRLESLRLLYGGIGWTLGPVLGVWLLNWWPVTPFVISGVVAAVMLVSFWRMRMGAGRVIQRAKRASPNPFVYLPQFLGQPRLVAGWLFAVIRSCGWWVYIVYLPIFAVENGLGDSVGGVAASMTNLGLFTAPLMLRWMQRRSVRQGVRTGFLLCGSAFLLATVLSLVPWATVGVMVLGSYCLVLLDICGGLPFLMSVKPSERAEMSAVYSSFRDVSGILTPGVAWVLLQMVPLAGIFAASGAAMLAAWAVAGRLHPQLGVPGAERVRGVGQHG